MLRLAKMGNPPIRWFSQLNAGTAKPPLVKRLATHYIIYAGRLFGTAFPKPEYVNMDHACEVAEYMVELLKRGQGCVLETYANSAVRVCQVASDKKLDIKNVSGVAVSIGPGSYTGLRIGLAAAKGIAFGLNAPITGVPTLDSLAVQYKGSEKKIWTVLPFRRDELYSCRFKIGANKIEKETGYNVCKSDEFLKELNADEQNVLVGKLKPEIYDKFKEIDFIKKIEFGCEF